MKRMCKRNRAKANALIGEKPVHLKLAHKPLSTTQSAIPKDERRKKIVFKHSKREKPRDSIYPYPFNTHKTFGTDWLTCAAKEAIMY